MTARRLARALVVIGILTGVASGVGVPRGSSQTSGGGAHPLVGRWSGSWSGAHWSNNSGRYSLTIERVDGEKVFGQEEITGRSQSQIKVRGRLTGNTLTYGKTSLTIDGDEMRGTGPNFKITLTREK